MSLLITATGTEVGKTFFSTLFMMKYGIESGWKYWKPVETGPDSESDSLQVESLIGKKFCISPTYRFAFPASPHYSARLEGTEIDPIHLKTEYEKYINQKVLIEGAGGVYVPLTEEVLSLDFWVPLRPSIILVSSTGLGTINHTIMTIEAIRRKNLNLIGFYMIGKSNKLFESNRDTITRFTGLDFFGVSFLPDKEYSSLELVEFAYSNFDSEKKLEKYL